MAHSVVEYLDFIVEIMILVSFFSVCVLKKIHRKVLTIFHFIFYVYFFRSNIFSLGWGGEIHVLCISCMVLRLWEIYFSSVSIFFNIHTSTYFKSYQQYNPCLIRNVEKQIIVIEISLF